MYAGPLLKKLRLGRRSEGRLGSRPGISLEARSRCLQSGGLAARALGTWRRGGCLGRGWREVDVESGEGGRVRRRRGRGRVKIAPAQRPAPPRLCESRQSGEFASAAPRRHAHALHCWPFTMPPRPAYSTTQHRAASGPPPWNQCNTIPYETSSCLAAWRRGGPPSTPLERQGLAQAHSSSGAFALARASLGVSFASVAASPIEASKPVLVSFVQRANGEPTNCDLFPRGVCLVLALGVRTPRGRWKKAVPVHGRDSEHRAPRQMRAHPSVVDQVVPGAGIRQKC